jgi:hypothetical protein
VSLTQNVILSFVANNDFSWHGTIDTTLYYLSPDSARTTSFLYILSGPLHSSLDLYISFTLPSHYPNLGQELLEWSDVLEVSFNYNLTNTPQSEYTEMVYGDGTQLIGYSAVGVGHTVPVHETVGLAWFCISAACAGGITRPGDLESPGSCCKLAPRSL